VRQAHAHGSHFSPENTSICTTSHQVHIECTRLECTISREILGSARPCTKSTCRAHPRLPLFPGEYFNPHNIAPSAHHVHRLGSHSFPGNTSIRATLRPVEVACDRQDRTIPLGKLYSAQLRAGRAPSAHARIALFPGENFDPRNLASREGHVGSPGSHSFPGNTLIRTTLHRLHIRRTRSDRTLSREIRRSVRLRTQ